MNHFNNYACLNIWVEGIITNLPLIESIDQPAMIFRIKNLCLGEMLAISRQDIAVFSKLKSLLVQYGLSNVKHSVISAPCYDISFPICQQDFRCLDRIDCAGK